MKFFYLFCYLVYLVDDVGLGEIEDVIVTLQALRMVLELITFV